MDMSSSTYRIDPTNPERFGWFDLDGVADDKEREDLRAMGFGSQGEEARQVREDEKKEASKVLMFSGLEAQSEIDRLLDELYGSFLDRTSRTKSKDGGIPRRGEPSISRECESKKKGAGRFAPPKSSD